MRDVNKLVPIRVHGGLGAETVNEKMEPKLGPISYMGRVQVWVENDLKNKNFTAYNKEGKIDTVHSEILKKLEDKNSDYYKFFRIELEEKMNKAKKNSQTTVNLNIPFFDYPTNKEEINTTGIKGSKYEKSSTPNSTEVKIMINHGKENLKRGVY